MQFSANIMPNNRLSSPATSPGSASDQSVKTLEYRVYDVKTGIYIPACDKYVCSFQHGCLLILSLCKHALRAFTIVLWAAEPARNSCCRYQRVFERKLCFLHVDISGGSRISPRRGRQLPGGRQHTILPNFPKNCMKLKEFGRPGGARAQNFTMWIRHWTCKLNRDL